MRTPVRKGHPLCSVNRTSSSSSLKPSKTSVSEYTSKRTTSTSIKRKREKNRKPKKEESPRIINALLSPSKSKSDSCVKYENAIADATPLPGDNGNRLVMKTKLIRAVSDLREKAQKKCVIAERVPDAIGDDIDNNSFANAPGYCRNCKSNMMINNRLKAAMTESIKDTTIRVAPPPSGYFLRDDISTEESAFDKRRSCGNQDATPKQDTVSQCTFGYGSWCKSREKDNAWEMKSPSNIDASSPRVGPRPKSRSPRRKKRSQNSGAKESPKKKSKKVKRRKNSQSAEHKDKSAKKTKTVEDFAKTSPKKMFGLKTGIAFRHETKNDRSHPIRYKQKILDPNNSKFFKTMGSLPVSMESTLYYYEPQGKTKLKNNLSQNRNIEKTWKAKGVYGRDSEYSSGLSRTKINKVKNAVYLNTNVNANPSDHDLSEPENALPKTHLSTMNMEHAYNEITGMLTGQDYNNVIEAGRVGSLPTNDFAIYSERMMGSSLTEPKDVIPPLLASREIKDTQHGLDLIVDDILESAAKEEEYERQLASDTSDKPAGETGRSRSKTSKSATFSLNMENNVSMNPSQKRTDKDDEHSKIHSSKSSLRPDFVKMYNTFKRVSSSSPNLGTEKNGDRSLGGKQPINPCNYTESPLRSKSTPQTNKFASSSDGYRVIEFSPDIKSLQSTPIKSTVKLSNIKGHMKKPAHGADVEEIGLAEGVQERGRQKQSREEPPPGSILRKSKSVPQGEKRTQPHPIKFQRKRKSTGSLKKSHSMSPGPFKGSNGAESGGTPIQHSRQSSGECLRKKNQTLVKKSKKKVRIVVDWNAFPTDRAQKANGLSPKETGLHCGFSDEANSKPYSNVDVDVDSSCDFLYDAAMEMKETLHLERAGSHRDEELESETKRDLDLDNEDGEKPDEEEPYNILCGFSEGMKDHDKSNAMNVTLKDVSTDRAKVKKVTKTKKVLRSREDKTTAEKGWDSNFVVKKEDSKSKLCPKKKRYHMRKTADNAGEKHKSTKPATKEINECDPFENKDFDTPVDLEKSTINRPKRPSSPQMSRNQLKMAPPKRGYVLSPTGLRKKIVCMDPRGEGSSVDAPVFNARRESVVRLSKSNPLNNAAKQSMKEAQVNAPKQRVKQTRESFARMGRNNKYSTSPFPEEKISEISPHVSRSTDLDVACSKKQLSPGRGAGVASKAVRSDPKLGPSKPRPKGESADGLKDIKEEAVEESVLVSPPQSPTRVLDHNFSDPEMNVINLGLHWVAQRIMQRLSFFKSKAEEEEGKETPASPVLETPQAVEIEKTVNLQ